MGKSAMTITPEGLRTVRLRSGIEVVNGITGETGPTFSEYVLLSDYQELQGAHAAALEKLKVAEAALVEIRETWAGSECGEPVTAQEGYAIRLCKQQYNRAVVALAAIREK